LFSYLLCEGRVKYFRTILVIYLVLLFVFVAGQENRKTNKALFVVDTNTYFFISSNTHVVTSANIDIKSSFKGKGILKVVGVENSGIDAHCQKVANLRIEKGKNSRLAILSDINITQSLDVRSGTLIITDFNIILESGALFYISQSARLKQLGRGSVIRLFSPRLVDNTFFKFQYGQYLFFNTVKKNILSPVKIITYENVNKVLSFNAEPPVTPG